MSVGKFEEQVAYANALYETQLVGELDIPKSRDKSCVIHVVSTLPSNKLNTHEIVCHIPLQRPHGRPKDDMGDDMRLLVLSYLDFSSLRNVSLVSKEMYKLSAKAIVRKN